MNGEAFIIVDFHKAFGKTGGLPVEGAEKLAPHIQKQMNLTRAKSGLILATRDWHPKKTVHFQDYGGPWTVHGVGGSQESEYIEGIDTGMIDHHIYKGYKNSDDGYSGFDGVDKLIGDSENGFMEAPDARTLLQILTENRIKKIIIGGVATDFCVSATGEKGIEFGFDVEVLRSCIAAVNVPGLPSGEDKLRELAEMGAKIIP